MKISSKIYHNEGNTQVLKRVPKSAINILDIGCGQGDNARVLKEDGKIIDGITISESEFEFASNHTRNMYLHNLEEGLPEKVRLNHYDAVIASHVLEHICYPDQVLSDIASALKPAQGVLIVALPNIMHYKSRIELIKGNFNYNTSGIWDDTHFKWYTYISASRLLENSGFEVISRSVSGLLPFHSTLKRLPLGLYKLLNKCLLGFSPGLFGSQLIYVARPK